MPAPTTTPEAASIIERIVTPAQHAALAAAHRVLAVDRWALARGGSVAIVRFHDRPSVAVVAAPGKLDARTVEEIRKIFPVAEARPVSKPKPARAPQPSIPSTLSIESTHDKPTVSEK